MGSALRGAAAPRAHSLRRAEKRHLLPSLLPPLVRRSPQGKEQRIGSSASVQACQSCILLFGKTFRSSCALSTCMLAPPCSAFFHGCATARRVNALRRPAPCAPSCASSLSNQIGTGVPPCAPSCASSWSNQIGKGVPPCAPFFASSWLKQIGTGVPPCAPFCASSLSKQIGTGVVRRFAKGFGPVFAISQEMQFIL